ncbi:S8 family serine peptidase [Cerasibacillus terrae]|nr:S8 family serine peptidase [Cerasibacillus terrae]
MKQYICFFVLVFLLVIPMVTVDASSNEQHPPQQQGEVEQEEKEQSIIVETSKDPHEAKQYIETYHPSIKVVTVYDQLFQGMALKASPDKIEKIGTLDFVQAIHPVQTYKIDLSFKQAKEKNELLKNVEDAVIPSDWNKTNYTGKGVKVAVIDTGIDYEHPDLEVNYKGGYDLVDLDEDPMETKREEGIPTLHGTHVAGIIAADGQLKGVAPDAEIYAYRALGPGGIGSSIQVIAALEQAVKDGADIINLSLGNSVNGPDYPTSIAVNKAVELGTAVVIANGNSGPETWTVGAPATATKAISVGAYHSAGQKASLYDWKENKHIAFELMRGSVPWKLEKDYPVTLYDRKQPPDLHGKIALIPRGKVPFYELAKQAEKQGAVAVIIYNHEEGVFQGAIQGDEPVGIPVAAISKQDGKELRQRIGNEDYFLQTKYQKVLEGITDFSSRGPVTVNWQIKPNIVAPGKNILSTIPSGYEVLNGTSMAAPFISGIFALMKEAHPDWTNEEIISTLQTTTKMLVDDQNQLLNPSLQGMGLVQIEKALDPDTIIHQPFLTFGKALGFTSKVKQDIWIENKSNQEQIYYFDIPKKQSGVHWDIPRSVRLKKNEKKRVTVGLNINTMLTDKGLHEGWLQLNAGETTYQLPYTFISKEAKNPKLMGFEFSLKPFSKEEYQYRLYATDEVEQIDISLYGMDTLLYQQHLLTIDQVEIGVNEGYISKKHIKAPGFYRALVTIQLKNGTYENKETEIYIEP